jgi:hypothetical protein
VVNKKVIKKKPKDNQIVDVFKDNNKYENGFVPKLKRYPKVHP